MKTVGFKTRLEYLVDHVKSIVKSGGKEIKLIPLADGMVYLETENEMTESQKAFMKSFQENCDQYSLSDDTIEEFLIGNSECAFEGYGALADSYNIWNDALRFAKPVV